MRLLLHVIANFYAQKANMHSRNLIYLVCTFSVRFAADKFISCVNGLNNWICLWRRVLGIIDYLKDAETDIHVCV